MTFGDTEIREGSFFIFVLFFRKFTETKIKIVDLKAGSEFKNNTIKLQHGRHEPKLKT